MPGKSSGLPSENDPRTYSASGFWKVALYVCSALAAAGGAVGVVYSAVGQFYGLTGRLLLACISLAFTALGVYLVLWLLQSKTLLYSDRIAFVGVFSTKAFLRDDLRGWRVLPASPPTLVIEQKKGPSFKTGLLFQMDDQFLDWFDTVPSLDVKEIAASEASVQSEIQSDERFGVTPSDKSDTLRRTGKTAKILSAISISVALWAFFYPRPYDVLMGLLALLPWIAIEVMRRSHGLVRADELKNDTHPTVAYALMFPAIILCLRAVLDFDVLHSLYAVSLYVLAGSALFAAILVFDPTQRCRPGILLAFFLLGLAYGYGAVVEADVQLDRSPGIVYTAIIQSKKIISGKSTTYRLELSQWGPTTGANELDVTSSVYNKIQSGQTVQLKLKKGALGIQWYYLYDW